MDVAAHLVLARHGQSVANARDVFTGWSNPPLTPLGRDEARTIAYKLIEADEPPDRIFSSPFDRCEETVRIILETLGLNDCPVARDARLNERDYGLLTGQVKSDIAKRFGSEQLKRWRRSYAEAPPMGESLRDTAARVLRAYLDTILPAAMAGGTTLVVSSGNALRSLVMALDRLDEAAIETFDIGTGAVFLYELGSNTAVLGRSILHNRIQQE